MLSEAPGLFEGSGASQRVYFDGVTNSYATSSIDQSTSTTVYSDAPSGWSHSDPSLEITDLSAWFDVPLLNPGLDDWHTEKWIVTTTSDNGDNVPIPDSWTFVKTEAPPGTQRVAHPRHGIFEIDWDSGLGYLGTIGCRFEAKWASSSEIFQDEMYVSQQVSIPRRDIRSAEVRVLYKVADYQGDTLDLSNQTHLFIRFAGYEGRFYVFEPGDSVDTWLEAKLTVPSSAFASYDGPDAFLLDIGMGTEIDGVAGVSRNSFLWIDEIRVRTLAEPYPDQINLLANGTAVSGLTKSGISPYVPDGADRDCFSAAPNGVDLDGANDNGLLFAGLNGTTWASSSEVQVGLQFPLDVPQGAIIDSAILEVEAGSGTSFESGLTTRILVSDEDTVSAFTGGLPELPDRFDWVNTSIDWEFTNWVTHDRYNSPDIAALIQETVSRDGWQSGNYICIMLDYTFTSTYQRWIDVKGSSNYFTTDLARLYLDYSTPTDEVFEVPLSHMKKITIDRTKVHGDLVDFPVMLDIYDADLRSEVQPDGDDIRFVSQGQSLDYEIQEFNQAFNSTHAHLIAWVRVPFLSSLRDTTIAMWYGNDALSSGENPDGVWNNGYAAVWHMEEDPGGSSPQIADSTQPQSDGTTYGSMSSTDLVPGISGSAIDLDGSNDYIDFGVPSELQITGAITVEAWFKPDVIGNDYLIARMGNAGSRGWDISFDPGSWEVPSIDPDGILMCRSWDSSQTGYSLGWERINISEWYHVAFVFEPSVYTRIFINGQMVAEDRVGVPSDLANPAGIPIRIATREPVGEYFNATVDETRISNIRRSPEWFATQYNNMKDPDQFYRVEEEPLVYKYKKEIAIDNAKVTADLSGFPVLIDIIDSDLKFKAQADGDDIIFKAGEIPLSHEIELLDNDYNSTHARLVAWVKTDLSSTVDTTFTMCYGNPLATNQESPHSVWSDGYWGVWHLGETNGDALDSTSFGNDGTLLGGPTRGVAGPVGYAYEFDGADDYLYLGNQNTQSTGTYSFWFYPHNIADEINIIAYDAYRNRIAMYNARIRPETATESEYFYFTSSSIAQDAWQHVVFVRSGDFGDLYINGTWIEQVETVGADTITVDSIGGTVDIDRMFDGPIDEVRISTIARSADWAITEFNNQEDPASFISLGEEKLAVSFDYKKDIVVDHNEVSADLTDFPVLVDIFDTDLKTDVRTSGDDIIFMSGGVLLSHELEFFDQSHNSTHARLVAWVSADLSASSDTVITMYYGNPSVKTQDNAGGVWNTAYSAVWHLNEDPTGTVFDSSRNNNDGGGLPIGSEPSLASGQIHNGSEFHGTASNERIEVPHNSTIALASDMTVEAWVRTSNTDGSSDVIVSKWGDVGHRNYWLGKLDDSTLAFFVDNTQTVTVSYSLINDGFWHHVVGVASTSNSLLILYVDGVQRNSAPYSGSTQTGSSVLHIGNNPGSVGFIQEWDGRIDEVRVSSSVRNSNWILTEYKNQYNPSSFFSVGAEQINQSAAAEEAHTLSYILTANHTSAVQIQTKLSMEVHSTSESLTNDLAEGTSFTITNGTQGVWTANVLLSPPAEVSEIGFSVEYPVREWNPTAVANPLGDAKDHPADWTFGDGLVTVYTAAVDSTGLWTLTFEDNNHVFDMEMGLQGGPLLSTDTFSVGDTIQFRPWATGLGASLVELYLTDSTGSLWYYDTEAIQGLSYPVPFNHKKNIVVDNSKVESDLTDFPVLIELYDSDLRTDVQPDGDDIAFIAGTQVLAHEIEVFNQTFNSTHAHLIAWVRVPALSGSVDTTLNMYYGNPGAIAKEISRDVWDSGYLGVWHLDEDGTGSADEYTDSSKYGHHGQGGEGNVSYVPTRVSGKVGAAQDFNNLDGYYDLIDCGDSPLWDITGTEITLQAWIYHEITPNTHIYGIMNHKGWYDGYAIYVNYGGGSTLKPTFSLPGDTHQLRGANDVTAGSWHHFVATYNGSLMRVFIDGVQDPNVLAKTNNIEASSFEKGMWIGHGDQPKDRVWSAEWDGLIDEVRISNVERSSDWIKTEFNNQDNPAGFYTVGSEESSGYYDFTGIQLNSTAPAGVWYADARFHDNSSSNIYRTGAFQRSFIVTHSTSLALVAPSDAIGDNITSAIVGDELSVEVEISDTVISQTLAGLEVKMNWTVGGSPTEVLLNDHGNGRYGVTLNTSDLGSAGRWRVEFSSYHQFYSNSTGYIDIDVSHETFLTYETPASLPVGDDFTTRVTLYDEFDGSALSGATLTSNGTIIGLSFDYGNGTYLITFDGSGLSLGDHLFEINATPSSSYHIKCGVMVTLDVREIITDSSSAGVTPVQVPWGHQANASLRWFDIDHGSLGVSGGTVVSNVTSPSQFDWGDGNYTVTLDLGGLAVGTHWVSLVIDAPNYEAATILVPVLVVAHRTAIGVQYNSTVPVQMDTYFQITFYDTDEGSSTIPLGNLSQIDADWGTGSTSFSDFNFWLGTSTWAVGVYSLNVTVSALDSPRYYEDVSFVVELTIRKLDVYLSWESLDSFPSGNDFEIFLHVNVSDPTTPFDGDPLTGLGAGQFSAENQTGSLYTIESLLSLGDGRYQMIINGSGFLEGDYTLVVFLDFAPAENYTSTSTGLITFTYRAVQTTIESEFTKITTIYSTNVTVTLNYIDIDNNENITTGAITAEGASIEWQHIGDGFYQVLIAVSTWDQGTYNVNLTADATGYEAKTVSIEIVVRIAYAYARPWSPEFDVSSFDLPVGDSVSFFVDYWDIDHDTAILNADVSHDWLHSIGVTWTGSEYRIDLSSLDDDSLQTYIVMFNFSRGPNFQFGYFNISITLRTHNTDFQTLAVPPTSHTGVVNVSLYYGDLDNDVGIKSQYVLGYAINSSGVIPSSFENDTSLGAGYYILRINASEFAALGLYNFTIHVNWTGPVSKFYNRSALVYVRIVGEISNLELVDSPGPVPYLSNMTYLYRYSGLYSGEGITNITQNVFIAVSFDASVDLSSVMILEAGDGEYSITFNTTLFNNPGVYTLTVYFNWSKGVDPFYQNRTHSIPVSIYARNTVLSVTPPPSSPWGVLTSFSFTFDDVTSGIPYEIANSSQLGIDVGLPVYTISYNSTNRKFTVVFNSSILGLPLGPKSFSINVTWSGSPFYSNITNRVVLLTITYRETILDFVAPDPTPFGDNVTFTVSYFDTTEGPSVPVDGGEIRLYNGSQEIPGAFYNVVPLGGGEYEIELNTTYFVSPGAQELMLRLNVSVPYLPNATASRSLILRYRLTTISVTPISSVPFNSSIEIILHYRDMLSLIDIGNESGAVSIEILNGSSWHFTSTYRSASGDYLVLVDTYDQLLSISTPYVLWINVTYLDQAPFYRWADAIIQFQMRPRGSSITIPEIPYPTPYLEYVNLTVSFSDTETHNGIPGAEIQLFNGPTQLSEGSDYLIQEGAQGEYFLSVNSSVLNGLGITAIEVRAVWSLGAPHYENATINVDLTVTSRPTGLDIVTSPVKTRYQNNVTFVVDYSDLTRMDSITVGKSSFAVYSESNLLTADMYAIEIVASGYLFSINSTVFSPGLVSDWNLTILVNWNDSSAPYYSDASVTLRITTTQRVGTTSAGAIPTVHYGSNITLTFKYFDESTGQGIAGSILSFDCLNPSGLLENVDYWVIEGVGSEVGNYSMLVKTTSLGIGTFTFSVGANWNSSISPYYTNASTFFLSGSVRLIQALLQNDAPSPPTVPVSGNVSLVLNLTDQDNLSPILNADLDISLLFRSTNSSPTIWQLIDHGGGIYEAIVNCSDLTVEGTDSFIVTFDSWPYQRVQVLVPLQIRLKDGVFGQVSVTASSVGEDAFVVVELLDRDSGYSPIVGAQLNLTWGGSSSYLDLGNGQYNITLNTTQYDSGSHELRIHANATSYSISDIVVYFNLADIPAEVTLPIAITDVYWGDSVSFWAFYRDTLHDSPISGAALQCQIGVLSETMSETGGGNYSYVLDTGRLTDAQSYIIIITAQKENYQLVIDQISLNVLKLPLAISVPGELLTQSLDRGSSFNVTVYIEDSSTGLPLESADVTIFWEITGPVSLSPVVGQSGYYAVLLDTSSASVKTYTVQLTADRHNYDVASTTLSLTVTQIPTEVWLDDATLDAEERIFNWSDTVRIGVYVLVPSENLSDPLSTGRSNSEVSWSLSGTNITGTFLNGTDIGGAGYFYYDFDSTVYLAGIYTIRISAHPLDLVYSDSSTRSTLVFNVIATTSESPLLSSRIWEWTGWFNFTYWDELHDVGIGNATATCIWNDAITETRDLGAGLYSVFINTTQVTPGSYQVVIDLEKPNYRGATGVFTLVVESVPTSITAYAPEVNQVETSVINLRVPYGDIVPLSFYYQDLYNNISIVGATELIALVTGPSIPDKVFLDLTDSGDGNYSLQFDTQVGIVSETLYNLIVKISLGNHSAATLTVEIEIINVPTSLTVEESTTIAMLFGESVTVWVFYQDTWPGHSGQGISGAEINATSFNTVFVSVELIESDPTTAGRYGITLVTHRVEGATTVSIQNNKENYDASSVSLSISVRPSAYDEFLQQAFFFGVPIGFIAIVSTALWARVFRIPKRMREISGMMKSLSKGKIPKKLDNVPSRSEIAVGLWNDLLSPVGIARVAMEVPEYSISAEVPEIEELLVQLSILTQLTPDEFTEFKLDVSKMRVSEQVAFTKEVINQEAIRKGKQDGSSMEEVLERTREMARAKIAGEETLEVEPAEAEPEVKPKEAAVEPKEDAAEVSEEPTAPVDKLSDSEIKEIEKLLKKKGVPKAELKTIIAQMRELDRELADELLRSFVGEEGEEE
jgi:hypothetical protein